MLFKTKINQILLRSSGEGNKEVSTLLFNTLKNSWHIIVTTYELKKK